jgi:hypothetical protein
MIGLARNEKYKNIEYLYTCDVHMSEEPIFSYTFLE